MIDHRRAFFVLFVAGGVLAVTAMALAIGIASHAQAGKETAAPAAADNPGPELDISYAVSQNADHSAPAIAYDFRHGE